MRCLWRRQHTLTINEIYTDLALETKWTANMVRSLVFRMIKKKVVGVDRTSYPHVYYPLVDEEFCIVQETILFLNRFFDGSAPNFVAHMILTDNISEKECEQILQLVSMKRLK